ncbi:STAS domain-containing protein [Kitasatospora sp. NPDC048194]|uniref:STAS domain-containing protein n=1 Tax=Kitasatospora sp. NPDC048194 TaxID=3364045 RepID=UPI00371D0CB2
MSSLLSLTEEHRADGRSALVAEGEIDMTNAADLTVALDTLLGAGPPPVLVDLTRVGYLDSAGLSVLLARAERIEIRAPALLVPVLTICGLTDMTTVHDSGSDPL